MFGQPGIVFFIPLKLFSFIPLDSAVNIFLFPVIVKFSLYDAKISIMFNILAIDGIEITFAQGQVMNGIQDICLSNPIRSNKAINPVAKLYFNLIIVLEIYQGKILKKHGMIF
jgi:hypothetical protein